MSCAESYIGSSSSPTTYPHCGGEWSSSVGYISTSVSAAAAAAAAPYPPSPLYGHHLPPPSTSHWITNASSHNYPQNQLTSSGHLTGQPHSATSTTTAADTVSASTIAASTANTYKWMHIKRTATKSSGSHSSKLPGNDPMTNRQIISDI